MPLRMAYEMDLWGHYHDVLLFGDGVRRSGALMLMLSHKCKTQRTLQAMPGRDEKSGLYTRKYVVSG